MKRNMLPFDSGLRAFIGLLLLASPLLELRTYPLNLLGAMLIATALVAWCPAHALIASVRRLFEFERQHARTT